MGRCSSREPDRISPTAPPFRSSSQRASGGRGQSARSRRRCSGKRDNWGCWGGSQRLAGGLAHTRGRPGRGREWLRLRPWVEGGVLLAEEHEEEFGCFHLFEEVGSLRVAEVLEMSTGEGVDEDLVSLAVVGSFRVVDGASLEVDRVLALGRPVSSEAV